MDTFTETLPRFIDLEASSLSLHSYPIEVAWSGPGGEIETHLIRPDGIPTWVDWNKRAALVHGITRQQLSTQGSEPWQVYQRLAACLSGCTVYSDNPDYDALWLVRLCDACCRPYPAIDLRHMDSLLLDLRCPDPLQRLAGLREVVKLKQDARSRIAGQHRAVWDVQYLLELWRLARRRPPSFSETVNRRAMPQGLARQGGGFSPT